MNEPAERTRNQSVYIKSLDGIRAISVMLVFWAHMDLWHVFPGLFAVNVFFFLSGFLITTLMMREYAARGRVSIVQFYIRRALRILPPMYIVLALGVTLTLLGVLPGPINLRSVIMQGLHLTNYYLITVGNAHFVQGLGVYWSLAVEEHYYLVFPLVFALCYPRMNPGRLAAILAGAAVIVLLWRTAIVLLWHPASSARTWAATDTRIDSILWGCVLALWRNPALNPSSAQSLASVKFCLLALAVLATTLIFYPNTFFRETLRYTLESVSLMPLFCAAILNDKWFVVKLLNTRLLRWVGQISYTMYLSHLMFFFLFRANFPRWSKIFNALVVLACTLLFCQLIRMTVEIPLARIRKKHSLT
jgi:peptidoglycan/LPS O-acetylase OafA/YrhL